MRSPWISSLPAASSRRLRMRHTSPSSSPYLKVLREAEWTTTVESGSWPEIASKTGSRGSVDAILEKRKPSLYTELGCGWWWGSPWRRPRRGDGLMSGDDEMLQLQLLPSSLLVVADSVSGEPMLIMKGRGNADSKMG